MRSLKKIICPLDFSSTSYDALKVAQQLARRASPTIHHAVILKVLLQRVKFTSSGTSDKNDTSVHFCHFLKRRVE